MLRNHSGASCDLCSPAGSRLYNTNFYSQVASRLRRMKQRPLLQGSSEDGEAGEGSAGVEAEAGEVGVFVEGRARAEDLGLADVGVAAVLVHGDDADLEEEGAQDAVVAAEGERTFFRWRLRGRWEERDEDPAGGFAEVGGPDFDEVVEGRAGAHRQLLGRVALVLRVVEVKRDLRDGRLAPKLEVYQVRLPAVALPVRVQVVVPQLRDAVARFRRTQRPHDDRQAA
mmetsp:Transcript_27104/g.83221  ORF Transcript_27104/g.83221 Transcript_27104/m.83221 type:complete len:227 (-) Transcript_27104:180-860(-)